MSDLRQQDAADHTNALLYTTADDGPESCLEFMTATPPAQSNVLMVSYTESPDDWLRAWLTHGGDRPAEFEFIQVGETMRSTAAVHSATPNQQVAHPITAIADPSDVSALGIAISECLANWADTENQTVVCVDSLTALLHEIEPELAFRFLHTLVGRVQAAEARACYTITPSAHDDQTLATLADLFDTRLE